MEIKYANKIKELEEKVQAQKQEMTYMNMRVGSMVGGIQVMEVRLENNEFLVNEFRPTINRTQDMGDAHTRTLNALPLGNYNIQNAMQRNHRRVCLVSGRNYDGSEMSTGRRVDVIREVDFLDYEGPFVSKEEEIRFNRR